MDYEIVEVAPNLSGVFPTRFGGKAADVVAVNWRGKLYTGAGKPLAEGTTLTDFCGRVGIKPKPKKPSRGHKSFLFGFRDTHFPKKPKKGKKKPAPKKPPRELTPAEKRDRKVVERLKEEFRVKGGKSRDTVFLLEDKHGKDAETVYRGKGKFEPVRDREAGTKTLARNRWAAKQLAERYHQIDGELVAEELKAEEAEAKMTVELEPGSGTTRCPCDGHANGDEHPSGLYDTEAGTFQCLTTSRSWELVSQGESRWELR